MVAFVDANGNKRPTWWRAGDEQVWGHITEEQFKESQRYFTKMLAERKWRKEVDHIKMLKRMGKLPKNYPLPIKPKLLCHISTQNQKPLKTIFYTFKTLLKQLPMFKK